MSATKGRVAEIETTTTTTTSPTSTTFTDVKTFDLYCVFVHKQNQLMLAKIVSYSTGANCNFMQKNN